MNILIIDDDRNFCDTLKDIFDGKNCLIDIVHSGEDAISKVKQIKYDIIFLDMKLPHKNGLDSYLAIRIIDSKVIVVLMTAYQKEMKNFVNEALEKGANTCFYKPFDPQKIVDFVEKTKERT